jgi:3-methyladenine DNA glycosylase/8-oxoguanine DNA glycosylase
MPDAQVLALKALTEIKGVGPTALRTLLVRMRRPNIFVGGDSLVHKWMKASYGIDADKTDAATERARIVKAAAWAPWRSVVYLLIMHAKDPATGSCVLG